MRVTGKRFSGGETPSFTLLAIASLWRAKSGPDVKSGLPSYVGAGGSGPVSHPVKANATTSDQKAPCTLRISPPYCCFRLTATPYGSSSPLRIVAIESAPALRRNPRAAAVLHYADRNLKGRR